MAWANRRVTTRRLLRNWAVVYVGNFVGALGTAALAVVGRHHHLGGGAVGRVALALAVGKVQLDFAQAVALGVLCNALVCLAVWMTFSARSSVDRVAVVILPISAFVAAGFEHSVANMYFVPVALLIAAFDPTFVARSGVDVSALSWTSFLTHNLAPVTLGNIVGGGVLVAAVYWFVYLRRRRPAD